MAFVKEEVLRALPAAPGVYIMKDTSGRAIYIGKAKNLKNRVRSYFHNGTGDQRPQIPYLVQEISNLDYFVSQNEREALVLENALIKKHKPKYNILLKDDKNYSSLRLDLKEKFPKLTYTRRVSNDGAMYFGPFASGEAMRQTKRLIHKIFPLRDCTDEKFRRHSQRPCLNYHMKLCSGPCAGKVDEVKYNETVEGAKMFLKGEVRGIIKLLRKNMDRASRELRYEDAAHYRDQIKFLEKNLDVERLISASLTDKDIAGFHREGQSVEFVVLFSRGGAIIDKAEYSFDNAILEDEEILREFLGQFYNDSRFIPNEILIPSSFEGMEVFSNWLSEKRGKRVKVFVPKRGAKAKLVQLAMTNAEESFKRKSAEKMRELGLLERVKNALSLTAIPVSVECFDISNIQGNLAVASMVRFENGKPARNRYKKFKIKTIFGANDYAMMYEVISRRFKRADQEGWELPNLILIDGGKGQLNIAYEVLRELGLLEKVALASIAKGREEREIDKIYIPGRKNPLALSQNSPELLFFMRVRDEAHRFAITYHKQLRSKKAFESELDPIPGIGKKRKTELLKHFGSVSAIRKASIEELLAVPGMNRKTAEEIKRNLTYVSLT
ncbi:MAG TPA: excinuclease ABC subunit UvrC [Thermodesulfobacteriota bacterium]|nr:excinuclease ABC subunit UvrC [Thermodesulfobacteriota bacterium]